MSAPATITPAPTLESFDADLMRLYPSAYAARGPYRLASLWPGERSTWPPGWTEEEAKGLQRVWVRCAPDHWLPAAVCVTWYDQGPFTGCLLNYAGRQHLGMAKQCRYAPQADLYDRTCGELIAYARALRHACLALNCFPRTPRFDHHDNGQSNGHTEA